MKENDIRNPDTFDKYLELVKEETERLFGDKSSFTEYPCPACSGGDLTSEFRKNGFQYVSCKECHTLFVNPRPGFDSLKAFYSNSSATEFWVNSFFKPVIEARRKNIFKPRAENISGVIQGKKNLIIGDIGAGFGLFLEELKSILPDNRYIAIEPSREMSGICAGKKLEIIDCCLEEITGLEENFDLLSAFEIIEHLYDPSAFFKKACGLLKPGGYFFLTTLNIEGFDIQLLWDNSRCFIPPVHLNFFTPDSLSGLLEKSGFSIIRKETPGRIDWDIVENFLKKGNTRLDKFWNLVSEKKGENCKRELQEWITKNNLSSHMRILAKRQ